MNKPMIRMCVSLLAVFLLGLCTGLIHGDEDRGSDALTGDWGGLRSKLEKKGITLEIAYTGEMVRLLSGGLAGENTPVSREPGRPGNSEGRETAFLDNKDIKLGIDADALMGWKGAEFFLYILGNAGRDPSAFIGENQTMTNIETGDTTWKIFEAWYQQAVFNGALSFKLGLYDLNSEFDVIDAAGIFINSSFGIGPDFSQGGENGPSIFPTTSLALRVRAQTRRGYYLQAAVLDGFPGAPGNAKGTHIILGKNDGLLIATEAGREGSILGRPGKLALGAWFYTAGTETLTGAAETKKSKGAYFLAQRQLLNDKDGSRTGIDLFFRLGAADSDINRLAFYMGAGLVFTRLIPGRDDDQLGLGLAYARNGDTFMEAVETQSPGLFKKSETIVELTYLFQATPWFSLQPTLQYFFHPWDGESTIPIDHSFVFGLRAVVNL